MAPIRLRHPKGVSTIQAAFDKDDFTVQGMPFHTAHSTTNIVSTDLQQEIYAVTEILPSRQACRFNELLVRIPAFILLQ
jgi:ubiquitin thioesterase OTU1